MNLIFITLAAAESCPSPELLAARIELAEVKIPGLVEVSALPPLAREVAALAPALECQRVALPPSLLHRYGALQVVVAASEALVQSDPTRRSLEIREAVAWLAFTRSLQPGWTLSSLPELGQRLESWAKKAEYAPSPLDLPPLPANTTARVNGGPAGLPSPGYSYVQLLHPDGQVHQSHLFSSEDRFVWAASCDACACTLSCLPPGESAPGACEGLPTCAQSERPTALVAPAPTPVKKRSPVALYAATGASAAVGLTGLGLYLGGQSTYNNATTPEALTRGYYSNWAGGGMAIAGGTAALSLGITTLVTQLLTRQEP